MTRWLLAAGLVAGLFAGAAGRLAGRWADDPSYALAGLAPPAAALLAWRAGRRSAPGLGEPGPGLAAVVAGSACAVAADVLDWPPLAFVGFFAVVRGLLTAAGGRAWAGRFTGPLLVLGLAFPLPATWTAYAGLWLQDATSRLAEAALSPFVVVHRAGHTLRLAGVDGSLTVAAECSGFGQAVGFLALAVGAGELLNRPGWHRLMLAVVALPLAVLANAARVVLMNLGVYWFGAGWTHGVLHDAPAVVCVPLGAAGLLLVDRLLAGRGPHAPRAVGTSARGPAGPLIAVLLVACLARLAVALHLAAAGPPAYPPPAGQLSDTPLSLGGWAGADHPAERDAVRGRLPFAADDLLLRTYRHPAGPVAQVYAVASDTGADRLHHPEICARDVGGAAEDLAARDSVPLGAGSGRRFRFRTANGWAVVYYWHYAAPSFPEPALSWVQRVHRRATAAGPSVTVQVTLPAAGPLVEHDLLPALDAELRARVLPAGAVAAGDRLPVGLETPR